MILLTSLLVERMYNDQDIRTTDNWDQIILDEPVARAGEETNTRNND